MIFHYYIKFGTHCGLSRLCIKIKVFVKFKTIVKLFSGFVLSKVSNFSKKSSFYCKCSSFSKERLIYMMRGRNFIMNDPDFHNNRLRFYNAQ